MLGPRPEDAARSRRVRPLVQVGGVPVRADGGDVHRDRPGGMGAVNEHRHTARAALGRNRRHRQHQRRLCGDVIHHDQPGPRRERSYERVDDVAGIAQRKWHLHGSQRRSAIACHGTSRQRDRAVRQIGDQHLVCGAERDDRSTALRPVVTLGTNTRSSGRAPRNGAICAIASRTATRGATASAARPFSSRSTNRDGWRSISSRRACCFWRTRRGGAPTVP